MPAHELKPGDRIGHYTVEARLGEGGMGAVVSALDTRLQRRVALKMLHAGPGTDGAGDARSRMLREARAAAALNHPNAVAIYEIGEHDGAPYLAMELVVGRLLRSYVKQPPAVATRIAWLVAMARALAAAHAAGLVHRDIKPENVMITEAGVVKVLDFGIARRTKATDPALGATVDVSLTRDGKVVGTPAYMAPEQIHGDTLDGRTDQFAWGVVAFELLSGQLPWKHDHDSLAIVGAIVSDAPRPLDGVAPEIAAVIGRALEKSPASRFASMEDAASALEATVTGPQSDLRFEFRSTEVPPQPAARVPPEQVATITAESRRRPSRRPLTVAVSFAVVASLVGAFAIVLTGRKLEPVVPASSASAAGSVQILEAPMPRTSSPEALAAYRAGLQAMHDGSPLTAARDAFARAAKLDPGLAAAHLRAAIQGFRYAPEEARDALALAVQHRAALEPRDRALLEATHPLLAEPSDLAEWDRRLTAALVRFPDDVELLQYLMTAKLVRYDTGPLLAVATRILTLDPSNGEAGYGKAAALAFSGDSDGAERAFAECLRAAPTSGSCLWNRMLFHEAGGQCLAAEADARRLTVVEPAQPLGHYWLAKVEVAKGELDAAREVLRHRWDRVPEAGRRAIELGDRARLALVVGDFVQGERLARELESAVASSTQLSVHRDVALLLTQILEETGRPGAAAEIATQLLARRGAWSSSPVYAPMLDATIAFSGVVARAGKLPSDAHALARRKTADDALAWFLKQGGPREQWGGRAWAVAYAATTETESEAKEALAALADFGPLPPPSGRWRALEAQIGTTFALAGDVAQAIPSLEHATRSCIVLDEPILHAKSRLRLGQARERTGDRDGACKEYVAVVARWADAKPRSVTLEQAKERALALRCATPR